MMGKQPERIYKITTPDLWRNAQKSGELSGMPIDHKDGYIHFSTAKQVRSTLRLHFKNAGELMLVAVWAKPFERYLKWEPARQGELFPHLYAPLYLDMVDWAQQIHVDADGEADLPQEFQ